MDIECGLIQKLLLMKHYEERLWNQNYINQEQDDSYVYAGIGEYLNIDQQLLDYYALLVYRYRNYSLLYSSDCNSR